MSFRRPLITAPIWLSGSTTLPIGLEFSELSPVRTAIISSARLGPLTLAVIVGAAVAGVENDCGFSQIVCSTLDAERVP